MGFPPLFLPGAFACPDISPNTRRPQRNPYRPQRAWTRERPASLLSPLLITIRGGFGYGADAVFSENSPRRVEDLGQRRCISGFRTERAAGSGFRFFASPNGPAAGGPCEPSPEGNVAQHRFVLRVVAVGRAARRRKVSDLTGANRQPTGTRDGAPPGGGNFEYIYFWGPIQARPYLFRGEIWRMNADSADPAVLGAKAGRPLSSHHTFCREPVRTETRETFCRRDASFIRKSTQTGVGGKKPPAILEHGRGRMKRKACCTLIGGFCLYAAALLGGCRPVALLDPKGLSASRSVSSSWWHSASC